VEELLSRAIPSTCKYENFIRYSRHVICNVACLGRHTISKLICTSGRDQKDWSAEYKLYSKNRINSSCVFTSVLKSICDSEPNKTPLVVAMDDTLLRKTGKKIPTTRYLRDPLGPPFQVNFVRGQRFVQISAALKHSDHQARMIPVAFENAPSIKKPKKTAPQAQWELYKEEIKKKNLSTYGCTMINTLKSKLSENDAKRPLWVSVDGSYTNKNVLRDLSKDITLIGRIRADAKLYYLPEQDNAKGRKRIYGLQSPTPEQLRQDQDTPYITVKAFAAGKVHDFKIKSINKLLWRTAGQNHLLRLIVIAPLGYRLTKGGKVLYRDPAYIICTDTTIPIEQILQAYLWRWDIEVNFRDEKTLLGVGQAQVRNENSVSSVPQMMVAGYATLLLAGEQVNKTNQTFWRPKWNKKENDDRCTTNDFIRQLRCDLWGRALNQNSFSDIADVNQGDANPTKYNLSLNSALMGATW
jgi:hypothetical protein